MLTQIGDVKNVPAFVDEVKAGHGRLMGFGHRVYKNYDPRAKIIKTTCRRGVRGHGPRPLLEIALELEKIALEDEYFVTRKLYPNVDFYSGLIYQAIGHPAGHVPGAVRHSAHGGLAGAVARRCVDPEQKIARPRQIYTGADERSYVPLAQREFVGVR